MKTFILIMVFFLLFPIKAIAVSYCQEVIKTGYVKNSDKIADKLSKYLKRNNVEYIISYNEITNTTKNFCKDNQYASSDDVTNHLIKIISVLITIDTPPKSDSRLKKAKKIKKPKTQYAHSPENTSIGKNETSPNNIKTTNNLSQYLLPPYLWEDDKGIIQATNSINNVPENKRFLFETTKKE